jgi:hypothetical protein
MISTDIHISPKQFTEKLGALIDLSDSFALSETLRGLPRQAFEAKADTIETIKDEFLQARKAMMAAIIKSFVPDAGTLPFKLALPDEDPLREQAADKKADFAPYLRLYAIHQGEMDFNIQKLRVKLRQVLSGRSAELAQLATLDAALGDALAAHTRKLFSLIPGLLGERFQHLFNEHQQALASHQQENSPDLPEQTARWLEKAYQEMQELLLAELEFRLLPLVGLIEALDEDSTGKQ